MINTNPQTAIVEAMSELTRVANGGTLVAALAPSAAQIIQAGSVSTGGDWQPYGRVGITPVSDFRAA